jgi:hypothetical protein
MKYLLDVLQGAGYITFSIEKRKMVLFQLTEYEPTILCVTEDFETELRSLVPIKECNRRILEDYKSTVPMAIYCLLRSKQGVDYGKPSIARASVIQMHKILKVSVQTIDKYKRILQEDGYIYPNYGELRVVRDDSRLNGVGYERDCNEYVIFDYYYRNPAKYAKLKLRQQEYKNQKGMRA